MKILEERYPKGTLKGQVTDGRYIDGYLWQNIDVLGKNITRDMTYLVFICSSTLEVGTGKSVFAQQFAEAYLESVRQHHKVDNKLNMNNLVWRPAELIKKAFEIPRFSVIILDEWEDAHYWSKLGVSLRQFFRKCRQLNLLMICIIPNFFQLPINYAVSRSVALIDVRFEGEFQRGHFSFYNFDRKKSLYIFGKRNQDYRVTRANFSGRFVDGYVVDEEEYREAKYQDMLQEEEDQTKEITFDEYKKETFFKYKNRFPQLGMQTIVEVFGVNKRTGHQWLTDWHKIQEARQNKTENPKNELFNPLKAKKERMGG